MKSEQDITSQTFKLKEFFIKNLIIVLLFISLAEIINAQIDTVWTRTYGGQYTDIARQVELTNDGGFIIIGDTENFGLGPRNIYTVKTDATGNALWSRDYGGSGLNFPYGIQALSDGYIIGSYTTSFPPSGTNLYAIKINNQGDTIWTSVVPNSNGAIASLSPCIRKTNDGGFVFAGSGAISPNFQQIQLFKLNSNGSFLWKKDFGGSVDDFGASIQPADGDNFILAGYTYSYGHGNNRCDGWLIKVDSNGDTIWTHTYGGTNFDSFYFVRHTSDGGYIAVGTTQSYGNGEQGWVVKTDAAGNELWSRDIGGTQIEKFQGVCETPTQGFILSGSTNSYGNGGHDAYFVEIDANGNILHQLTLGTSGNDYGATIEKINDNEYIASGSKIVAGYQDYWLIKLHVDVLPIELTSFTSSVHQNNVTLNWTTATETNNQGFEIQKQAGSKQSAVGNWESISFIPGFGTTTEPKSYSFVDSKLDAGKYTYRLKQIDYDGTFEYSNEVEVAVDLTPTEFALYQNYPNPFNPTTKISYSIPVTENVKLAVYNLVGEEVAILIHGIVEAGYYEVTFNASDLPSGVYVYRLEASNYTSSKKLILLR